jgi:hypothetical protein
LSFSQRMREGVAYGEINVGSGRIAAARRQFAEVLVEREDEIDLALTAPPQGRLSALLVEIEFGSPRGPYSAINADDFA